jgi:hypothetical protein
MAGASLYDEEAYGLDIESLLGRECLLTVVHEERNGNIYANILSASALPKGMVAPDMVNEPKFISVDTSPEEEITALPEFLKTKMYASEEWAGRLRYEEATGLKTGHHRATKPQEEQEPDDEATGEDAIPF